MAALPKLRPQSNEMLHLDLTRFVASVGIVAHHSIEYFVLPSSRDWLHEKTMGLALFVDLFFVISGFVIAYVYHQRALTLRGYGTFLQRRVGRLVPLHWLTLAVSLAIWSAFSLSGYSGKNPPSFLPECIADTALLLHAFVPCGNNMFFNGVSWSISAEMVMYMLAFPVIAVLAIRLRYVPVLLGAALLLLTVWLDTYSNALPVKSWIELQPVPRALPSFILGAALFYHRDWLPMVQAPKFVFAASLGALIGLMISGAPHLLVLAVVYVVAISAVASDLTAKPGYLVRRYGALGQLTYSIYMWHGIFILVLMNAIGDKLLHAGPRMMTIIAAICWGCIFIASYLSFFMSKLLLGVGLIMSRGPRRSRWERRINATTTPTCGVHLGLGEPIIVIAASSARLARR
jgi:peptidoglycan/LPS O-acetylase OafA/YrhL